MYTIPHAKRFHVRPPMDAKWVIQWYDWLLFLSGGKLYATNDFVFYANWTLKLLNALAYLLVMFADSFAPTIFDYNEASVVQWLADKVNALLALSFSVTLTYYGGQVTQLLEDCLHAVDDAGRKRIREIASSLSLFCLLMILAIAITGMVLDSQTVRESSSDRTAQLVMGAVLTGFISVNSWFNNAMILYVIFILTLIHGEGSQLKKMSVVLTTPGRMDSTMVQQMLSQRKHTQFLVSEINRLMGFCPLFMFGFMFILTPAVISDIREDPDVVGVVMITLFLVTSFAAIIYLLTVVTWFFRRAETMSQEVIEQMYSVKDYDVKCQELVRELRISNIRLTAWYLFDVNSNCFLSFASAIITFTVLFNQLNIKSQRDAQLIANATKST